jgi:hypothetical protein
MLLKEAAFASVVLPLSRQRPATARCLAVHPGHPQRKKLPGITCEDSATSEALKQHAIR